MRRPELVQLCRMSERRSQSLGKHFGRQCGYLDSGNWPCRRCSKCAEMAYRQRKPRISGYRAYFLDPGLVSMKWSSGIFGWLLPGCFVASGVNLPDNFCPAIELMDVCVKIKNSKKSLFLFSEFVWFCHEPNTGTSVGTSFPKSLLKRWKRWKVGLCTDNVRIVCENIVCTIVMAMRSSCFENKTNCFCHVNRDNQLFPLRGQTQWIFYAV